MDITAPGAIEAASFILSLREMGIRDRAVLSAMELVPRETFAPRRFADLSRSDVALPLPNGQTMTAPGTVAAMLVALQLMPGQRVLEVGTGSGYVTALLARMGAVVVSVERFSTLAASAVERLKLFEAGASARVEVGDGLKGQPANSFDRILLNGALSSIPAALTSILGAAGRLVGALAVDGAPRLVLVERTEDGELRETLGHALRISPLAPGVAAAL
jgi:protein-L-isoaspartate(D-aspartate) O-methyltransferase